ILRTPVCAVIRSAPIRGQDCPVAAELFAIAADAHRWLEQIDDAAYTCETPDGRGTSRAESGARLARMMCADATELAESELTEIARVVSAAQVTDITNAIRTVLGRLLPQPSVAVLAGTGECLGRAAAQQLGMNVLSLGDSLGAPAARTAPAA